MSKAPLQNENIIASVTDPHVAHVHYKGVYKTIISKTISIPEKFHNFLLLQCIICYLQIMTARNSFNLYKFVTIARDFVLFLEAKYERSSSIPSNVLRNYALYLSDSKQLKPASIRSTLSALQEIFSWNVGRPDFKDQPEKERTFVLAVLAQKPSIPINKMLDGTAPSMSELVQSKEYDDLELLNSLIKFCFGFLIIFQNHRLIITGDRRVQARLNQAKNTKNPDIDWHFLYPDWEDYNEIFNAIVASREATLLERLLVSNQRFQDAFSEADRPCTLEELYEKLKTCVRGIGSIAFTNRLNEQSQYVTFEQLDIRSLLSPSEAEEICFRWLLAVDRIQQSGQKQLTLDDADITPTHVTLSFLKRRANEYQRDSTIHRAKTYNYRLIKAFTELRKTFEQDLSDKSISKLFFQYENPFARVQHRTSISYRTIILACTPFTNIYNEISEAFPEAKLFQEYFNLLIQENTEARQSAFERTKSGDQTATSSANTSTRTLTANVVAQSRAIIDPEEPKPFSAFDRKAMLEAEADGAAHTVRTSQEVYRNRSQTAHRLGLRAKFVNSVGKLQEEDARRLSALMNMTALVTMSDVNEALGWDVSSFKREDIEEFNQLIEIAEADGYNCQPFGWLSKVGSQQRIIIITPVTAALINSYIQGCKQALKTSESQEKSRAIILQLCYAKLVLNSFDKRTIAEGRTLLKDYNFPPAII